MESGQRATKLTASTVPLWTLLVPVAVLLLALVVEAQRPDGRLHLWVLDVGQGDAILIRTPRGHTALIDGGPGATPLLNGLGKHLPLWQHDIDLVVLTHPHEDHLMGLVDLPDRYSIGEVVETQFTATVGVQGAWLGAVKRQDVPVHYAKRGETLGFEGEPDIELRVLSPNTPDALTEKAGGDINNTSIVLRLIYGKHSLLLEGDAQDRAESSMAEREGDALRSEVLKVGHHGSDTSSTPPFIGLIQPKVAIISVGNGNKYGHPAQQTLDTLQQAGAKVYRTDVNGTVEIIADPERLWVRSER